MPVPVVAVFCCAAGSSFGTIASNSVLSLLAFGTPLSANRLHLPRQDVARQITRDIGVVVTERVVAESRFAIVGRSRKQEGQRWLGAYDVDNLTVSALATLPSGAGQTSRP